MPMKVLFTSVFGVLVLVSLGLRWSFPDVQTERPVIYWVTDKNPAREQQVALFHEWLVENGHVNDAGEPAVELRLDVANMDLTKQTIQSVSGVAGDLMDTYGPSMRQLQAMGVLTDLTEDAEAMGFSPDQTYAAIEPSITVDGRQYRYPANVGNSMLWVNVDALRRHGLEPPPTRWTWEDFERLGVAFRDAANPPGTAPNERRFFALNLDSVRLLRTTGLSKFNETLTACTLDDPRYAETLRAKRRWVYDLNILPTPEDEAAFASQQSFMGSDAQRFGTGDYALLEGGRYLLILFRRYPHLGDLRVVEFPHAGFPCTMISSRAVALYAGSRHPELAKLFLQYLASAAYNEQIVADADALPPNPAYTRGEAFLRPPAYPKEWGTHGAFVETAETIAIGETFSPYVLPTVVKRRREFFEDQFMFGLMSADDAAAATADDLNARIADELDRKPELRDPFERDRAAQEQIDRLKAEGRPIPAELIKNPFHLAYYRRTGQLSESPATAAATVERHAMAVTAP